MQIDVVSTSGPAWSHTGTARANASGEFTYRFRLSRDLIPTYQVTATGPVSGTATATFTDAAGSYQIKWYAADPAVNSAPFLPTYNKVAPSGLQPYPSGRANDPLRNAVAFGPTGSTLDALTSLEPEYMALGQVVPFEVVITVTGSTAPEGGTITFQSEWAARTSSNGNFGFDPTYGLIAAFVDYGDAGSIDPGANATVSSFSWVRADQGTKDDRTLGTVTLTGLNDGDQVIVELWVVLMNTIPRNASGDVTVTGNVATAMVSASTGSNINGSTINVGVQSLTLSQIGKFDTVETDLSVTKSDSPDPVLRGGQLTYTLVATNRSTVYVANQVVVTDTLDPNTAFVSGTWTGGTCTAVGSVVTCALGSLVPLQSVPITIVTTVSPSAPYTNDTSPNPETGTCTAAGPGIDLCNKVAVTLLGTDPNILNNSDSEPTNVIAGSVTLTKVNDFGTALPGATFQLFRGTPPGGTAQGAPLVTNAAGQISVPGLTAGSYYFVETGVPAGYTLDATPLTFSVSSSNAVVTVRRSNFVTPTIQKWVTTSGTTQDSFAFYSDVPWILRPKVPGNIAAYTSFVIRDVLDTKLAYTGNLVVRVGATPLVLGTHYTVTSTPGAAGGTLAITLLPTSLANMPVADLVNNTVVTFTTQINDQAIMGRAICNVAQINYDDGVLPAGTDTAQSGQACVFTGGKVFKKVAETANGTGLAGAQFKVATDPAGTVFVKDATGLADIVLTSDADGLFSIRGLDYDLATGTTYYLVETLAPVNGEGIRYNLLQTPVPFTVNGTSYYTDPTTITTSETAPTADPLPVINKLGAQMPQTGGLGTVLFSLLGIALMGGALAARKK